MIRATPFIRLAVFLLLAGLCACGGGSGELVVVDGLKDVGRGLGVFILDDSTRVELMVSFSAEGFVVFNGRERVELLRGDGGVCTVPYYGGAVIGEWGDRGYSGVWIDSVRGVDYQIPFSVEPLKGSGNSDNSYNRVNSRGEGGEWVKSEWDTSMGRLVMSEWGDSIIATVLTKTGDYRYLSGKRVGDTLDFGVFDGAHLFDFVVTQKGDSLVNGVFKSGSHYTGAWEGVRVSDVFVMSSTQKHIESLPVEFTATNLDGEVVEWSRGVIAGSGKRGVVLNILGTWCPNCLDEMKLLRILKKDYEEVGFLSVAFERAKGERALLRLSDYSKQLDLNWPIMLGGVASKAVADSVLPFLGGVHSFPTTVFIPDSGDIVVHSGFSGPATESYYLEEVGFFRSAIEGLILGDSVD